MLFSVIVNACDVCGDISCGGICGGIVIVGCCCGGVVSGISSIVYCGKSSFIPFVIASFASPTSCCGIPIPPSIFAIILIHILQQ